MAATKVFAARLAGLVVLGPDGESIGRVRDVVISIRYDRQQPRVLGMAVELPTRKRIFVPMLRVTAIEPGSVNLNTGTVSLRRFEQRPSEMLALAQILDSRVRVDDPDRPELRDVDVFVVDLGIEQTRTRDWLVSRVAVRGHRRLGRRRTVHVVDWSDVRGLTQQELNMPGQSVTALLEQYEGLRAADVAHMMRELPKKRRIELARALDDERLADVVQELPETDQLEVVKQLGVERAADVIEAMDPDDAADLLGELPTGEAEALLALMDPQESEPVRRLLSTPLHRGRPDDARTGGADARRHRRRSAGPRARSGSDPALASMVFVVRPPTATPTGRYLGCVHIQQLLREPPASLVGGLVDKDLACLGSDTPLNAVTRYFATYNLVCGPVLDEESHLLGAVTVDDVLDHLLPEDWREQDEEHAAGTMAIEGERS